MIHKYKLIYDLATTLQLNWNENPSNEALKSFLVEDNSESRTELYFYDNNVYLTKNILLFLLVCSKSHKS